MRRCTHHVSVWLNDADYQHLQKQMAASGKNSSTLLRDTFHGISIVPRPEQEWSTLLHQISAIGNNINQLTRQANQSHDVSSEQIRIVQQKLNMIWDLLWERI